MSDAKSYSDAKFYRDAEKVLDFTCAEAMSDVQKVPFRVGDRVRARHDHSFEGIVRWEEVGVVGLTVVHALPYQEAPSSWFELVPDPPRYEVPVKLIASDEFWQCVLRRPGAHDYWRSALLDELAARGFVPEPDGEQCMALTGLAPCQLPKGHDGFHQSVTV